MDQFTPCTPTAQDFAALTARQQEIYVALSQSIQDNGYPPSIRELASSVGLTSPSSVKHQLDTLEEKGFIRRDPGLPRAIEVFAVAQTGSGPRTKIEQARQSSHPHPNAVGQIDPAEQAAIFPFSLTPANAVPLVGRIAAGGPILAEQNVTEVMQLPQRLTGSGELFMLEVVGDSMIDAAICSGDWVVIRRQPHAEEGQIVAALIEDEATVKVFSRKNGHVWLLPRNDHYEPIAGDHATILGKVVSVLRAL